MIDQRVHAYYQRLRRGLRDLQFVPHGEPGAKSALVMAVARKFKMPVREVKRIVAERKRVAPLDTAGQGESNG